MKGMRLFVAGLLLASVVPSAEAAPVTTPPGAYLFRNVRIWGGRSDAPYAGEVLVVGNRIQSVSHEAIAAAAGLHTTAIDGGGRVLMPGFIDAHVHMSSVLTRQEAQEADPVYVAALEIRGAEQALLRGFTTQRDAAGAVFGLKRAIDAGYVVGPRIYAAGAALSQTAGHGDDRHYTDPPRRLGGGLTLEERSGMTTIADAMMRLAKKYHVKLGFGTDLVFGLDQMTRQNREFTLRARWFSPVEILRQVTSGNAERLAMSGP